MITLEQVLKMLREDTGEEHPEDVLFTKDRAATCLEDLHVKNAQERVEWFSTELFDAFDILAMANADFAVRKCDICGSKYHTSEFLATYCVLARTGDTFNSASGNDIYICDRCSVTNKVVGLFVS